VPLSWAAGVQIVGVHHPRQGVFEAVVAPEHLAVRGDEAGRANRPRSVACSVWRRRASLLGSLVASASRASAGRPRR
jgi:hypothetical protein